MDLQIRQLAENEIKDDPESKIDPELIRIVSIHKYTLNSYYTILALALA